MGGRSGQSIGGSQEIKGANIFTVGDNINDRYSSKELKKFVYLTGVPKEFTGNVVVREVDENKIRVEIGKDGMTMDRTFDTKNKEVTNDYFVIRSDSKYKGKGMEIFKNQVDRLINDGNYKRIVTEAAGFKGGQYNGYYTWLKAGYKPLIAEKGIVSTINSYLRDLGYSDRIKKSSDIIKDKWLSEIWKEVGFSWRGEFELSKKSESYQILTEYLKNRK